MSYQHCPICKGKKLIKLCPICLGERIINEEDGLPPSKHYIQSPYVPTYPVYPNQPYSPTYPFYPFYPSYPIVRDLVLL